MGSVFTLALVISVVFVLFRLLEMKFVLKEKKPLKNLIRDGVLCYLSVVGGNFVIENILPVQGTGSTPPSAFINDPEF